MYILTNVMVIIFALYAQKFYILMTFNSFNASKLYVFPLFRDKEFFLLSLSMTRILLYKWVINWDIEYSCFYVLFTGADNMLSQCEILGLTFRISVYNRLSSVYEMNVSPLIQRIKKKLFLLIPYNHLARSRRSVEICFVLILFHFVSFIRLLELSSLKCLCTFHEIQLKTIWVYLSATFIQACI